MTDTHDAVRAAIEGALADSGEMVTKWVSLIETFDSDGKRALWLLTNEDAKPWDNLGLLSYAIQREQGRILADSMEDD